MLKNTIRSHYFILFIQFQIVESCRVGMRKPEDRIYHKVLNDLGVQADETIFLDDLGVNLKPAKRLGMATIKVSGVKGCYCHHLYILMEDLVFSLTAPFLNPPRTSQEERALTQLTIK